SLQRPNEIKTTYSFDAAGELTRLLHANAQNQPIEDFNYAFNGDGEIESITSLASAQTLSVAKTGTPADIANRIAQFGQQSFVYDDEGQTTTQTDTQGTTNYQWDARGRLASATLSDGHRVSYGYDAMGRRTSRSANGATTTFLYDGLDVALDKETDGGAIDYLNGPGMDNKLRQQGAATGALYFLPDHLGSTAALTASDGSVAERTSYESFGDSAGSAFTRYGYTGRERDQLTRLMYYRARWYNPQTGRFLTEDPISYLGGLNLYAYVLNGPLNRTDPSGEFALIDDLILAGGGALVGVAVLTVTDVLAGRPSDWQHYAGAAAGGAVGGLAIEYTGGIGTGLLSGATTNGVTQLLEMQSGKQCEFDFGGFAIETGLGGIFGALPDVPVQGLSSGRNNWNALAKSVRTKISNGTIENISASTAGKMLVGNNVAGLNSTIYSVDADLLRRVVGNDPTNASGKRCRCR